MHSVQRSPEPSFWAQLRATRTDWNDLDGEDRLVIRDALAKDFGASCGYCERHCEWPNSYRNSPNQETIEHFRPRNRFPDLWFDWLNLIYVCHRCNQAKLGSWPEYDDQVNQELASTKPQYKPVSKYVSPNDLPGQRPANEFFAFDVETGEMMAAEQLDDEEWSVAHRTIWDIDLNDMCLGENDQGHLWNLRRGQLDLLVEKLNAVQDQFQKVRMALDFTQPDKPFSSFISAYLKQRFPELV